MQRAVFVLSAIVFAIALILTNKAPDVSTSAPIAQDETETSTVSNSKRDAAVLPVVLNASNDFVLANGIRDVFEAIILATDSTDRSALTTAAEQYCDRQQFSVAGCASFIALFIRYLDYKTALASVEQDSVNYANAIAEIEARLDAINALQYAHFDREERQALFGEDDAIERAALARHKIAADPTLSKQEKVALLNRHFETLPAQQRKAFEPSLAIHELHNITQLAGSSDYKLEVARARFGDEAADRLAATWQRRADFETKLNALKNAYKEVPREQQLLWLEQHFSTSDARRARALLSTL